MIDTFLHNIAWLRKHHGLSKKVMARRLGIGIWSLNKIENGQLPPRLHCDIIFAVHQNFGISCADLLDKRLGCEETDCHTSDLSKV